MGKRSIATRKKGTAGWTSAGKAAIINKMLRSSVIASTTIDADAQSWVNRGVSVDSARANNVFRALKAVKFTSSNAFADIKAAGGTIQVYRGLNSVGSTVPDLTGNCTATLMANPTFSQASGITLDGTSQYIGSGYTIIQTANFFAVLLCNHISVTAGDGLLSDASAATGAFDMKQNTGNVVSTGATLTSASTISQSNTAAYVTGVDYQHGALIASGALQGYSNSASAEAFTTDGTSTSMGGLQMRSASGQLDIGRSGSNYANIQVHAMACAPLAPTAAQLQNLVDALEVFWQ